MKKLNTNNTLTKTNGTTKDTESIKTRTDTNKRLRRNQEKRRTREMEKKIFVVKMKKFCKMAVQMSLRGAKQRSNLFKIIRLKDCFANARNDNLSVLQKSG